MVAVHHLNCCTIRVPGGHAMIDTGSLLGRAEGVTHCILVETSEGLLLVDTGMGRQDCLSPTPFMRWMIAVGGFPRDLDETAHAQVQRLGYRPEQVRHIALTHFHFDHAGGLPDFPEAQVHLYAGEYEAVPSASRSKKRTPSWQRPVTSATARCMAWERTISRKTGVASHMTLRSQPLYPGTS